MTQHFSNSNASNGEGTGSGDGIVSDDADILACLIASDEAWAVVEATRLEIEGLEAKLVDTREWGREIRAGFISGEYSLPQTIRLQWALLRWEYTIRALLRSLRRKDRADVKAWMNIASGDTPAA